MDGGEEGFSCSGVESLGEEGKNGNGKGGGGR